MARVIVNSKRWVILLYLTLLCSFLSAQKLQVCDDDTRLPLPYATLFALDVNITRTCNAKGVVEIKDFTEAQYITVAMLGYDTCCLSFHELIQLDTLFLRPKSYVLSSVEVVPLRQSVLTDYQLFSFERINVQDLSFYQSQTSADLLGLSGDVFIQKSQQGGGSPMIRGFAANRLLYTVDGVRMNTAIFRSGNLQNVISLDAHAMASTQVLLGANSVMYGSDAIGGVMAFESKSPLVNKDKHFALQFNTATATANSYTGHHMDLSYGNAVLSGLTSLSYQQYGQVKMGSHGPDDYLQYRYVTRLQGQDYAIQTAQPEIQKPVDFSQVNVMQKVYYTPRQHWQIYYGFHYSATSEYDRYDRLLQDKNNEPRYAVWKYGPQRWMMNHLNVQYTAPQLLFDRVELKMAHQHFEESRISRSFNSTQEKVREEAVEAYSINLDLRKRYMRHHFFYGFEGVYDEVYSYGSQLDVRSLKAIEAPSRYPQAHWSSYALFVNDVMQINHALRLNIGLRYNLNLLRAQFDTTFYDFAYTDVFQHNQALTWHSGLSWQLAQDQVYHVVVSSAFRAPNVDDMGKVFDSEPGHVIVPNIDLKPEQAYNFELRGKKQWDKASFETSLYYTYLHRAFIRQAFTYNGQDSMQYDGEMSRVYALQNSAHAFVYGASVLGDVTLPYYLTLSASYHYQYGRETRDDGQLSYGRHVAPNSLRISLKYQHNKLQAEVYGLYNAAIPYGRLALSERAKPYMYARDSEGNPYSPAFYTLNVKCAYHFSSMIQLNVGVENMTDQRYRPYSSGLAAVGRNVTLALQLKL